MAKGNGAAVQDMTYTEVDPALFNQDQGEWVDIGEVGEAGVSGLLERAFVWADDRAKKGWAVGYGIRTDDGLKLISEKAFMRKLREAHLGTAVHVVPTEKTKTSDGKLDMWAGKVGISPKRGGGQRAADVLKADYERQNAEGLPF